MRGDGRGSHLSPLRPLGSPPHAWGCSVQTGIPQIKPTFLDIAPSGIPSNIIPHSKGIKCGLIRSNPRFHIATTVLPSLNPYSPFGSNK